MITSINEFKQLINENTDVKDPNFDEFIRANAPKLVNRTSKYIPQLNMLLNGKGFIARGGAREGFRIENEQGQTVLSARMFRELMEKLRDLARPYAPLKATHAKETPTVLNQNGPTTVSVPKISTPAPTPKPIDNTPVMSFEELRNSLDQKGYESGRFYIDFHLEKGKDENNFRLLVAANSKRGYPREAYMKALSTPLPSLPNGYEYVDRNPKDYTGNIVTPSSIKADDDYYDDRGYTDSEFGGEIYYSVIKNR